YFFFFFFFQAEDGIRDLYVTGVQTCALPILPAFKRPARPSGTSSSSHRRSGSPITASGCSLSGLTAMPGLIRRSTSTPSMGARRSEERRVGKEGRSRRGPVH